MAEDIVSRLVLQGQQYFSTINQAHQRTQKFQKDSQQGFKNVTGAIQGATKALAALGAAAIARQIVRMINDTARWADELAKMSARTGFAVETLNGLTQAAKLADVSQEQLTVGLFQLNKNLLDTTRGTGEARESFKVMGIEAKDAAELLKNPEQSFLTIAQKLADIPDPSRRAAEAMRIFGRSGAQLLPLLNQGSEAIARQIKEQQRLRPITEAQAKAAEAYNDSLTNLQFAFEGLLHRGVAPLLPHLTAVVDAFTELVALDIDGFNQRLAAMTGEFNAFRGVASIMNAVNTLMKDLAASAAITMELIANPQNYQEILKLGEEIDREIREEANRRQSQLFPEATGGKPRDFSKPPASKPTRPSESVAITETLASTQTASLLKLKEAELALLQVQKERDQVVEDSSAIQSLKAYIVQLNEQLAIEKELEAAEKGNRAIDQNVVETARIVARTALVKLDEEAKKIKQDLNKLEQEGLGYDAVSTASQRQALILRETANRLAQQQHALQLEQLDPIRDAALLRGREIQVLQTEIELLRKTNEVMGESPERMKAIELAQARVNAKVQEGRDLLQKSLGEGIVKAATADLEAQLEPFRKAVRDAQLDVDLGKALPNQLAETNKLREIELRKANLALIIEEERAGIRTGEEAARAFILADAELRAATADTQKSFTEGWSEAFAQLNRDQQGAFGLGQVLARNFLSNIQSGIGGTVLNVFNQMEQGTLSWRTALQTIPDILKKITSELIAMAVVQTVTKAIGASAGGGGGALSAGIFGAGLSGLFGGGGGGGAGPFAGLAGQPGFNFAEGGSFIVGGRGGKDANPVLLNLTRGERGTIETAEQQRRNDRGGGGLEVIVNNFYAEGATATVQERLGLNGRILDVTFRKKVRDTVESEYGLNRKPGRVG